MAVQPPSEEENVKNLDLEGEARVVGLNKVACAWKSLWEENVFINCARNLRSETLNQESVSLFDLPGTVYRLFPVLAPLLRN